jgi:hypothetical protein
MATLARRLRQRLGVTSMFMLAGLVGTLCGSGCGLSLLSFPPQVQFISNGKYTGTLQTPEITLPITGTLAYLTGEMDYIKLHVSVDTGGQQITNDSWVTRTPTVINEWEIVSTDPTTCRKEVLSGDSYPQCTAWNRMPRGIYSLECTVSVLGNRATLDILAHLSTDNKLVQLQQSTTITSNGFGSAATEYHYHWFRGSITIIMTSQGTTPPVPSDFDPPSICNVPNGNNQG